MPLRTTTLTLVSTTELLMDRDNISFTEKIVRWQKDPSNADLQVPGDDRAPAWGWLGKLHFDERSGFVGLPVGMLQACLRAAAATIPHPTARGGKTLKEVSQAGIQFTRTMFPLLVQTPGLPLVGQTLRPPALWMPIPYPELFQKLQAEDDFLVHEAVTKQYGFLLDIRRASPQYNRKHIRVRPLFGSWRCVCTMSVHDDVLTDEVLLQMFTIAGHNKGIGNWRPSCSKAGSYGIFSVEAGVPDDLQKVVEALG